MNARDVYRLDTASRKRHWLAELPFEPRCIATGHGWFCAGGEYKGRFAAFPITATPPSPAPPRITSFNRARSSSDRRPNRYDTSPISSLTPRDVSSDTLNASGSVPIPSLVSNMHASRTRLDEIDMRINSLGRQLDEYNAPASSIMRDKNFGEAIVNSISIHRLTSLVPGKPDDIVALVTNNDTVVRIHSLLRNVETELGVFPFPMNHATISPDGKLLIIVGDGEWLYLYQRSAEPVTVQKSPVGTNMECEWEEHRIIKLHKPQKANAYSSEPKGHYFTTAWSPSGRMCAAASEDGYTSVFDVASMLSSSSDCEAACVVMPSSRSGSSPTGSGPGSVYSICFAPDPWDLLIWAERDGRIGVWDLRSALRQRQLIHLESEAENVTKLILTDAVVALPETHSTRSGPEFGWASHYRYTTPAVHDEPPYSPGLHPGSSSASQRSLPRASEVFQQVHSLPGVTPQEQHILYRLRMSNQQSASQETPPIPHSIVHPGRNGTQSTPLEQASRFRQDAVAITTLRDQFSQYYRSTPHHRDSTTGPNTTSTRNPLNQQRQRNSDSRAAWQAFADATGRTTNTEDPSYANVARVNNLDNLIPPDDGFYEQVVRVSLPSGANNTSSASTLTRLRETAHESAREANSDHDRRLAAAREQMRESVALTSRRRGMRMSTDAGSVSRRVGGPFSSYDLDSPERGRGTTGVVWDGVGGGRNILYVGTEEGIFEINMNFRDRQCWPDVEAR